MSSTFYPIVLLLLGVALANIQTLTAAGYCNNACQGTPAIQMRVPVDGLGCFKNTIDTDPCPTMTSNTLLSRAARTFVSKNAQYKRQAQFTAYIRG